jgi:hypothetical protein
VVANNDLTNVGTIQSGGITTVANTALLNVGDWDHDGHGDLVNRVNEGDKLVLLRGKGDGTFLKGVGMNPSSTGWGKVTQLAAVGDLTGDRRPDLVGRVGNGPMEVFPGDGKKGFLAPRLLPTAVRTFNQVGGAAWNPTRAPGSVLPSLGGVFVPYAGTSDARAALSHADRSAGGYDWIIGPGDVNGDGLADLLARQRSNGTLWLIPGTATGFGQRQFVTGGLGKYRLAG